jgi:hypothetical protein
LSKRGNSEGSLYQSSDGWRGYMWCTRPDGTRYRKYVRGKTYEEARQNWVRLRDQASRGPVSSSVPKLDEFLAYWLKEIVEPNLAPKTYESTRCSAASTLSRTSVVTRLSRLCRCFLPGQADDADFFGGWLVEAVA